MRTRKEFDLTIIEKIDDSGSARIIYKYKDEKEKDITIYGIFGNEPVTFIFNKLKILLTISQKEE